MCLKISDLIRIFLNTYTTSEYIKLNNRKIFILKTFSESHLDANILPLLPECIKQLKMTTPSRKLRHTAEASLTVLTYAGLVMYLKVL